MSLGGPGTAAPCHNRGVPGVMIFGAGGQLGSVLVSSLSDAGLDPVAIPRSIDIRDENAVRTAVDECRPEWIVNAAAMTDVDGAHAEPERAFAVNALGAGHIARSAAQACARFVHISTEAVFDGNRLAPYAEEDACRPVSVYGASKRAGESLVGIYATDAYILRTSWLYGRSGGANFPTRLIANLMRGADAVPVVTDIVGNPTPASVLASAVSRLIRQPCAPGTYHVCCTEPASKFDWAVAIAERAGFDPARIVPVTSDRFPTAAARPKHVDLNTARFAATGVMPLPTWREAWQDSD